MTGHKFTEFDMNSEKLARRKKMGDDPTAVEQSNMTMGGAIPAQPLPYAPQDGRGGNSMNNPMNAQSMGDGMPTSGSMSGQNMYPYNDSGLDPGDTRMGAIGFQQPSGSNQNMVPGQRLNAEAYNATNQPDNEAMNRMLPSELYNSAAKFSQKMYGMEEVPPYQIGALGMQGMPMEAAFKVPTQGSFPYKMPQQSPGYLPLQGIGDVQTVTGPNADSGGMDMGSGNRNKKA